MTAPLSLLKTCVKALDPSIFISNDSLVTVYEDEMPTRSTLVVHDNSIILYLNSRERVIKIFNCHVEGLFHFLLARLELTNYPGSILTLSGKVIEDLERDIMNSQSCKWQLFSLYEALPRIHKLKLEGTFIISNVEGETIYARNEEYIQNTSIYLSSNDDLISLEININDLSVGLYHKGGYLNIFPGDTDHTISTYYKLFLEQP